MEKMQGLDQQINERRLMKEKKEREEREQKEKEEREQKEKQEKEKLEKEQKDKQQQRLKKDNSETHDLLKKVSSEISKMNNEDSTAAISLVKQILNGPKDELEKQVLSQLIRLIQPHLIDSSLEMSSTMENLKQLMNLNIPLNQLMVILQSQFSEYLKNKDQQSINMKVEPAKEMKGIHDSYIEKMVGNKRFVKKEPIRFKAETEKKSKLKSKVVQSSLNKF